MLQENIVPGGHRIEASNTNWCLVEEDGRLTVVDAGVPSSWDSLHEALGASGGPAATSRRSCSPTPTSTTDGVEAAVAAAREAGAA